MTRTKKSFKELRAERIETIKWDIKSAKDAKKLRQRLEQYPLKWGITLRRF